MASGARSQDFFGQIRGFFKEFGAKRVGVRPLRSTHPPLDLHLLGLTYYDRARSIDLHDLTNVPMIKTRMTALAVKTFTSLETHSALRIWC